MDTNEETLKVLKEILSELKSIDNSLGGVYTNTLSLDTDLGDIKTELNNIVSNT